MRRLLPACFAALMLCPGPAEGGNRLLDPVTTHTNGMPLASSTTLRNHNAYYQCDPGRVGCCGGRYVRPCLDSLLRPNTCCGRWSPPQQEGWQRPLTQPMADVEGARFESLGQFTAAPAGETDRPPRPPVVLPEDAPTLAPFNALKAFLPE